MNASQKPTIGFIGQGFIGKNYADEFEERGFSVVRYALESPYSDNKDQIASCDIVFIAVPTPTTPQGFDFSIVKNVLSLVGEQKIAVIKSTILPGTTELLQKQFPSIFILHSPEFLREITAREDARHPERNIIGVPQAGALYEEKANFVMSVLPSAPYQKICSAKEAELVKYIGNGFLTMKVIFINMAYDLAHSVGAQWDVVAEAFSHDSRIGKSHLNPVHSHGRGAGGHCFIKDIEAYRQFYAQQLKDHLGDEVLSALVKKNKDLLVSSGKDLDILHGVYGDEIKI